MDEELREYLKKCKASRHGGFFTGRYAVVHETMGLVAESRNGIPEAWSDASKFFIALTADLRNQEEPPAFEHAKVRQAAEEIKKIKPKQPHGKTVKEHQNPKEARK